MLIALLSVFAFIILAGIVFVNHYPALGAKSSGKRLERILESANHSGTKFTNLVPTKETFGWGDYKKLFKLVMKGNPNRKPGDQLPVRIWKKEEVRELGDTATLIWYGHSAFYLKMNGMNILLDPMFGDYPAPLPWFVNRRFNDTLPIAVDDLPVIDVIVLSHDHYDHLDYGSILRLKEKTERFLVPLGVGAHLEAWGVEKDKIEEFYWYEDVSIGEVTFTSTPARHFSGRSISDKMQTLWCSWVITGSHNLFFSGDSGYFEEFRKIGDKYGPFDLCMLECGQYNELWKDIHMFPEETAQAHLDLRGKTLIPIHWGAFSLGMHDWNEPVKRLSDACVKNKIELVTPVIGEAIRIGETYHTAEWWRKDL